MKELEISILFIYIYSFLYAKIQLEVLWTQRRQFQNCLVSAAPIAVSRNLWTVASTFGASHLMLLQGVEHSWKSHYNCG